MIYIFHRKEGWYPVELTGGDKEVLANIECNPGTIKVEDQEGRIVWEEEKKDISQQMSDASLQLAIERGYVPKTCTLPGELVLGLGDSGIDPCKGCNDDRSVCKGRPK